MKLFECQSCGLPVHFENSICERCGHILGYLPHHANLSALEPLGDGRWTALAASGGEPYRICANSAYDACNWLIPAGSQETLCLSCRTNRTIPHLGNPEYLAQFQRLQWAKQWLFHGLLRFGLPVRSKFDDPNGGIAFDFLADGGPNFRESQRVMTGHAEGVITINIAEADDAERERQRKKMAEPYRTILGHFRHETGHHYWEQLVQGTSKLEPFRALFGDERADYATALKTHYANGSRNDWHQQFISFYASSHPWEDWAESWAHYMHIVDGLDTAHAYGLSLYPLGGRSPGLVASVTFDPYTQPDFDVLVQNWLPLEFAVNSLNRSVGQPDLYPFVLTPVVLDKLRFVHDLIWSVRG